MTTAMVPRMWDSMMARMTNPWILWMRVVLLCALLPAVWFHAVAAIVVLSVVLVVHPWWFPPREAHGWLGRVVAGTRRWFEQSSMLLVVVPVCLLLTAMFAGLMWALWMHELMLSVVLFAGVLTIKLGFLISFAREPAPGAS